MDHLLQLALWIAFRLLRSIVPSYDGNRTHWSSYLGSSKGVEAGNAQTATGKPALAKLLDQEPHGAPRFPNESVELNVASFRVSSGSKQSLEVVQYMSHAGEPSDGATNRAGNSHLCLLIDDLRAGYDDLQSRGVRFKSDPVEISAGPNKGGLVVYLYDPDGYMLELFQPSRGAE